MRFDIGSISPEKRASLESLAVLGDTPSIRRRAQLLLLYDEGLSTHEVAARVGLSRGRVRDWRRKFQTKGMEIFLLTPAPPTVGEGAGVKADSLPPPREEPGVKADSPLPLGEEPGVKADSLPPPREEPGVKADSPLPLGEEPGVKADSPLPLGEEPGVKADSLPPPREEPGVKADSPLPLGEGLGGEVNLDFLLSLKTPGVAPTDSLAEAGRKVLRFQFAQMLRYEEGTKRGEDIEALHDMRVATRRMRAAFEVFAEAFKPKPLKKYLKGVRATGRALGRVRDLDVFMEKAQRYIESLPKELRGGLSPLLETWQNERQAARVVLLAHLESADYQTFKDKFHHFLAAPGAGARKIDSFPPTPNTVAQIAPPLIYTRLAAVRAFAPLLNTASLEQLHALRIELKKLRYTLEFFREVLGEEAKEIIGEIKTLQDHLGDLNDANVACQLLRQFLEEWDQRQANLPMNERRSPQSLLDYLSFQHAERHRLMITFQRAWERFDCPAVRRTLAMAVADL